MRVLEITFGLAYALEVHPASGSARTPFTYPKGNLRCHKLSIKLIWFNNLNTLENADGLSYSVIMLGAGVRHTFTVTVAAVSSVGSVREHNEDCVLIGELVFRDSQFTGEVRCAMDTVWCAAVADGMGGAAAGEVASALALQAFLTGIQGIPPEAEPESVAEAVRTACQAAHVAVEAEAERDPAKRGMGTTLAAVLAVGGHWYRVHAGDSRVYRFRDGLLKQLTRDHSLREQSGDPETPANVITNAIGGGSSCFCDIDLLSPVLADGDRFLICSDGLHDYVGTDEIEAVLLEQSVRAEPLIEPALAAGAPDNVSVIVLELADG